MATSQRKPKTFCPNLIKDKATDSSFSVTYAQRDRDSRTYQRIIQLLSIYENKRNYSVL